MDTTEILYWLKTTDADTLATLWRQADQVRRSYVGDAVHLRGLVEASNYCRRHCHYCGLRAPNRAIRRYRLTGAQILEAAQQIVAARCGSVVLQAGEDPGLTLAFITDVVTRIKAETPLAVTLSLGERSLRELAAWRAAGADRYLLRFETSRADLYQRVHPPQRGQHLTRRQLLRDLQQLGYEVGSGVMVGLPGQTYADLVRDIQWFGELQLDMIGLGPFIPDPQTPLGAAASTDRDAEQVPADVVMACKTLALARILCPATNIPATTALETAVPGGGYELGLTRGANVVMPNFTPQPWRATYLIYPGKANAHGPDAPMASLPTRLTALGRHPGSGRGDSLHVLTRRTHPAATALPKEIPA